MDTQSALLIGTIIGLVVATIGFSVEGWQSPEDIENCAFSQGQMYRNHVATAQYLILSNNGKVVAINCKDTSAK